MFSTDDPAEANKFISALENKVGSKITKKYKSANQKYFISFDKRLNELNTTMSGKPALYSSKELIEKFISIVDIEYDKLLSDLVEGDLTINDVQYERIINKAYSYLEKFFDILRKIK